MQKKCENIILSISCSASSTMWADCIPHIVQIWCVNAQVYFKYIAKKLIVVILIFGFAVNNYVFFLYTTVFDGMITLINAFV